jgi:ankyrin repeat protein
MLFNKRNTTQGSEPKLLAGYILGMLIVTTSSLSGATETAPLSTQAKPATLGGTVQGHSPGQKRSGEPTSESSLMRAAQRGDLSTVEAELAAGAEINLQDRHGRTALAYAVANGHIAIVEALLKKGAAI